MTAKYLEQAADDATSALAGVRATHDLDIVIAILCRVDGNDCKVAGVVVENHPEADALAEELSDAALLAFLTHRDRRRAKGRRRSGDQTSKAIRLLAGDLARALFGRR